jgi:diguanylate cyclase (GGDEF)-like protein/putative nucleotidyltransferase with HDIG domain
VTPSIRADLTLGTAYGVAVSAVFWAFMLAPPRADASDGLLIVAAASAGAVATAFRGRGRLSPVYAIAVAALLVSGPAVSCLAGGVAVLGGRIRDRRAGHRQVIFQHGFRVARETLALALAAAGFVWASGLPITPHMLVALSVHAAIYATVRALLVPLVRLGTGGRPRLRTALHQTVAALPGCAAGAALAWAAAEALAHPDSRVLLLAAAALTAAWAVHRLHADRRSVAQRHGDEMIELRRGVTRALARTMEERDPRCQDHVRRVHRLCLGVAKNLGMPEVEIETLAAGALLHDIGKVSVPDRILSKPGRLTPQEMRQVERHPVTGAEIVQALPFRQSLAPVVRYHHERWDGQGYPDGLSREEIPLGARVLAAVDCYDALTTDRPYRKALTHREAAAHLSREAGTLFDPDVVDALLDYLEAREPARAAEPLALDLGAPKPAEVTAAETATGSLTAAQRELETLYDISRATGYGLNLEEFLTLAACRLSTLVPYQSLVVYFLDEGARMLRARFAMGRAADKLRVMTVPLGERLSGWAAVQQRAVIGRDHVSPLERDGARSDLEEWSDDPDVAGLKATLAAPMIAESGLVGVVTLYDRIDRGFTADERRLVVRVAGWAARVAAREEQASPATLTSLTDPLTGVPNARFLWLESAHRMAGDEAGFGLVAFRVGNLDRLGEESGNAAVDRTLCEVARRFASGSRRSETLVRFGQDLFIVLTPVRVAGELVGRWHDLASEVEQPLSGPGEEVARQVRLVAAHASYPDDGGDLDALLEVLDQRLGAAARQGRTVLPFRAPGSAALRSGSSG